MSNFKANLLKNEAKDKNFVVEFQTIIRAIFNLPELEVGYSIFQKEEHQFVHPPAMLDVKSYLLDGAQYEACTETLCKFSYDYLFN
ncbi:MAG: GAF domain-containing protein, partial [Flavobacteriaceae bacterium]|nr:GAF domain-containing protein [Flavobacteriaceae bacterium]